MRWHSTTHLIGRGYWVWLIPLGSGGISIGIVVDETVHPWHRLNRFERAMEWLHEFEPQCADYMEKERDNVEDFLALRHFAHGCARVYSTDRWLLTGEAGVFTDPFYSPGSDFIAMGNELITDLIMRDRRGEDVSARIEQHNNSYLRLFEGFLRLYEGQYPLMGNAQVMTAKAGVGQRVLLGDPGAALFPASHRRCPVHGVARPRAAAILRAARAHADVPAQVGRARHRALSARLYQRDVRPRAEARFRRELAAPPMDDETLRAKILDNFALLERFARALQQTASARSS